MLSNISRRQFVEAASVVAAGLGLAACGNSSSDSSDTSTSGSTDTASTIKVGILGPHTGDVSSYGIACKNGAQLYFNQVNDNGGINGKQVEMVVEDEKGDATEAVNAYNKMVEAGVVGIVGDVTTGPTVAVAKVSAGDNMPCVTPSATAADVVAQGSNYFRACITDPEQGRLMAVFAAEQGYKTVATIYKSGSDYEEGVNDAFVEECANQGITVATEQAYSDGDVDFSAQLTNIIATTPDAVLAPNYYQEDGMIVTQARQQGYDGVFLGVDGWSGIRGSENYAEADDLHDCYFLCAFSSSNDASEAKTFIEDYTAEYGDAPTNFCALGYDAAMVLANGITAAEEAGLEAGSDDYLQAVIDGIAGGTVEGITGSISYDGTGDPVKSSLVLSFDADGNETVFETIEG